MSSGLTKTLLVVFIIITGLFIYRDFIRSPKPNDTVIITDTIPGDTVFRQITVHVPKPVYIDTGSTLWKFRDIDTAAILKNYFSKVFYSDTILDINSFEAVIQDSLTQNRIAWRSVQFKNLKPTQINHYYPVNTGQGFYPGIGFGTSPEGLRIGLGAIYKTKGKWQFSIMGDNKGVMGGVYLNVK